jgi:hypothetical protein
MCPELHAGEIRVTFSFKKQIIRSLGNGRISTPVPRILI